VLRPYNARVSSHLAGKRVLVLGAETEIGRAVASATAEAGASVAAVAATSDAEAAFAVQRLSRQLSSGRGRVIAQAIDATNEAAVRVMVRQVSKELGGLHAAVFCADLGDSTLDAMLRFKTGASRELIRGGGGSLVLAPLWLGGGVFELASGTTSDPDQNSEAIRLPRVANVSVEGRPSEEVIADVLQAIAGEAESG
jgi:NAD(P)-dependent dehydrogenase (short-subunit alcohol dehydrogenase family)